MEHLLKLSDSDLRSLATAFKAGRATLPVNEASIRRFISNSLAEVVSAELGVLASNGFTSQQIAYVLELLLKDRDIRSASHKHIDLVTSGPEAHGVTNRDTSIVVRELFLNANETVLIAGYAVYQGRAVFEALANRMEHLPSLKVQLYLDIQRQHNDHTEEAALAARFKARFRDHEWPPGKRNPQVFYYPRSLAEQDKKSCLHAKCVVVDKKEVFISSANFTEAGHERNVEIGLLLRSEHLARQITMHFESLAAAGEMRLLF